MGMLFNTDSTLEILKRLNDTFNKAGLHRLVNDPSPPTGGWISVFQNLSGSKKAYADVAKPLGIDFDVGSGGSPRQNRWKKYLNAFLDTQNDAKQQNLKLSQIIGLGIADALNGKLVGGAPAVFAGVEFFAVPEAAANSSYVVVTDATVLGETTKIITIHTVDVSTLFGDQAVFSQGALGSTTPASGDDDLLSGDDAVSPANGSP